LGEIFLGQQKNRRGMSKFLEENLIDSMDEKSKGTILRSMAIFVAIEVCGSFLTGKTGIRTTKDNFISFISSKYVPEKYRKVGLLLYSMFRNSVSHHYIPKGAALLTSDSEAQDCHLQFYQQGLCIFVPKMAGDITEAIKKLIADIKKDAELQKKYYAVLKQLDRDGKKAYEMYVRENGVKFMGGTFRGDISIKL
jgi:hypothetical protein